MAVLNQRQQQPQQQAPTSSTTSTQNAAKSSQPNNNNNSQSATNVGPRVSFNRDVHVKRIGSRALLKRRHCATAFVVPQLALYGFLFVVVTKSGLIRNRNTHGNVSLEVASVSAAVLLALMSCGFSVVGSPLEVVAEMEADN